MIGDHRKVQIRGLDGLTRRSPFTRFSRGPRFGWRIIRKSRPARRMPRQPILGSKLRIDSPAGALDEHPASPFFALRFSSCHPEWGRIGVGKEKQSKLINQLRPTG